MANVIRNKTFTSPDFLAAAYFAVGWTSEGSSKGKELAYQISFAGIEGKILEPRKNSAYSIGVIQTDFGQHPDAAKHLVEKFQVWAEKNRPDLKFAENKVQPFISDLARKGYIIENRDHGRPLDPKIKPALNEFLKSKEGIDFVHAHDVKQIGELHQKIFEPLTRSPAYKNSSYEDQLKLSVALAKLANMAGFRGTRKFMDDVLHNKDGKFDNFQEVYEQIKIRHSGQLSDVNRALQGAKVFIALEKSNPNIPLHQSWDAIRPLALANPNDFSGEGKRQRDEIKALFIDPDWGWAAIRKQQAEFESKAPENHQADANLPKGSETVAGAFRINTALAGKLSPDSNDGPDNGWNNGPGSGGSFEM